MPTTKNKQSKGASTMEELLASSGKTIKGFKRSEKIQAKVIEIGPKYVTFDVGGKSEGILYDSYFAEARDLIASLSPGDTVQVTVIDPETPDGSVLVSLRHAAQDRFWEELEKAQEKGLSIWVSVKAASTKGLNVEVDGNPAFIPLTQIGKKTYANLDDLVGKRIKVKVLESDKQKRRIVLSERAISEEKEIEEMNEALKLVEEGKIYTGKVRELTSFGAFVEIPVNDTSVEGLVHVTELAWQKVKESSDVVSVGQEVAVKVIGLRDGKLALSMKQAMADPWTDAAEKYHTDDKLKAKVIRTSDFGVFAELEPGIEGLIHITKIPPATRLNSGDLVDVYIEDIDTKSHKISLGLVLTSKPVGYK